MVIALLIIMAVLCWGGMLFFYYRSELTAWFDNRFGPDTISKEEELRLKQRLERRQARWHWYK